jgi:AhpD family alkylhydroperoxidase
MVEHALTPYDQLTARIEAMAREAPGVMGAFGRLHAASQGEGVLQPKVKELMALAIGIALRCDGCMAYHLHDALAAGATRDEVVEAVGVAVMMGGGPAVVYGSQVLEALADGAGAT